MLQSTCYYLRVLMVGWVDRKRKFGGIFDRQALLQFFGARLPSQNEFKCPHKPT
jgi:hypothetical protein